MDTSCFTERPSRTNYPIPWANDATLKWSPLHNTEKQKWPFPNSCVCDSLIATTEFLKSCQDEEMQQHPW